LKLLNDYFNLREQIYKYFDRDEDWAEDFIDLSNSYWKTFDSKYPDELVSFCINPSKVIDEEVPKHNICSCIYTTDKYSGMIVDKEKCLFAVFDNSKRLS
jgi:hypothetical protein